MKNNFYSRRNSVYRIVGVLILLLLLMPPLSNADETVMTKSGQTYSDPKGNGDSEQVKEAEELKDDSAEELTPDPIETDTESLDENEEATDPEAEPDETEFIRESDEKILSSALGNKVMSNEFEENFAGTIDLSESTISDSNPSEGYRITGCTTGYKALGPQLKGGPATGENSNGQVAFNTNANGKTFRIIQSGLINNQDTPKNGTSIFIVISIDANVHVSLVLEDIDLGIYGANDIYGFITLGNGSELTLLLGKDTEYAPAMKSSYVRSSIRTHSGSKLIIDSATNSGSSDGTLTVTSHYDGFAAIGGNSNPTPATANSGEIVIDGGTVNATNSTGKAHGAAIGGGSISDTSSAGTAGNGNVSINGGLVNAVNTGLGAAIGGGAVSGGYFGGCNVAITGGKVIATGKTGAGIGGGAKSFRGGSAARTIKIDSGADIKAYSSGENDSNSGLPMTFKPAIDTGSDNQGSGYFVNANFNTSLSSTSGLTLNVCKNNSAAKQNTLLLPKNYRCFAYSTGSSSPQIDNIWAYNGSKLLGDVVRVFDDSPEIYSVNALSTYNPHNNNAGNAVLPVKLGIRDSFKETSDLTISKTVAGEYADMTKDFTFTVYFEDSDGLPLEQGTLFSCSGTALSGNEATITGVSSSGAAIQAVDTIELDGNGKAAFTLKHGGSLTIKDIVADGSFRVTETESPEYTASFEDNEGPSGENDTGIRNMSQDHRFIDFTNTRDPIVESGIETGNNGSLLLLPLSVIALILISLISRALNRRRKEVSG